jgi:hypothetical protein
MQSSIFVSRGCAGNLSVCESAKPLFLRKKFLSSRWGAHCYTSKMNYQIPQHVVLALTTGRVLEHKWPRVVPVLYEGKQVGIAQFDGARYIYNLEGELARKRNEGVLNDTIEFETIDPPTDANEDLRIARIHIYEKNLQ